MSPAAVKRQPLTPARIVQAALAIADADGLEALTMRRLALELGAAPMAAYAHFAGKRELLTAVVDAVMGEVELPEADGRWRKPIRRLGLSFRAALLAHPAVMPAVHACGARGPKTLELLDRAHRILRSAGFADEQAAGAVDTLHAFALGAVSLEIASTFVDPPVRHVMPNVPAGDREDRFRYGLDTILDGLAATKRST